MLGQIAELWSVLLKLLAKHPDFLPFLMGLFRSMLLAKDPWRTMQRKVLAEAAMRGADKGADTILRTTAVVKGSAKRKR